MGPIVLPTTGTVYLDANTLIYGVEKNPVFWPLMRPVMQAVQAGLLRLSTSELSLLEVLVGPMKAGNAVLEAIYESLLHSSDVDLLPIDAPVLRQAARLRAAIPGLRTPDAIHAATAILHPPAIFLTNDPGFRRVPGLPVDLLSDHLTP